MSLRCFPRNAKWHVDDSINQAFDVRNHFSCSAIRKTFLFCGFARRPTSFDYHRTLNQNREICLDGREHDVETRNLIRLHVDFNQNIDERSFFPIAHRKIIPLIREDSLFTSIFFHIMCLSIFVKILFKEFVYNKQFITNCEIYMFLHVCILYVLTNYHESIKLFIKINYLLIKILQEHKRQSTR